MAWAGLAITRQNAAIDMIARIEFLRIDRR
jgi:hypothetical protein